MAKFIGIISGACILYAFVTVLAYALVVALVCAVVNAILWLAKAAVVLALGAAALYLLGRLLLFGAELLGNHCYEHREAIAAYVARHKSKLAPVAAVACLSALICFLARPNPPVAPPGLPPVAENTLILKDRGFLHRNVVAFKWSWTTKRIEPSERGYFLTFGGLTFRAKSHSWVEE